MAPLLVGQALVLGAARPPRAQGFIGFTTKTKTAAATATKGIASVRNAP